MDVARKDIVLSQGWDEDQFRRMAALAGGDVEFGRYRSSGTT